MSKHTATLMEVMQSELQNMGLSEFVNNGRITFNNSDFAFIQKVLKYDKDVSSIVDNVIFKGFSFSDKKVDRYFKEAFINRFMDREINRQTVDAFATQVLYVTLTHEDYIYNVFSNEYVKFLQNHVTNDTEDKSNSIAQELQDQNTTEQSKGEEHQKFKSTEHQDFKGNEVNDTTGESHEDTTGHESTESATKEQSHEDGKAKHREATATLPQSQQNLNLNSDTMAYADSQSGSNDSTTNDKTSSSESNGLTQTKGTADGRTKGHSNTDTKSTTDTEVNSNTDTDNENLSHTVSNSNRSNTDDTRGTHTGLTKSYDLDNLEQIFDMKHKIFEEYDKKCFLQIW